MNARERMPTIPEDLTEYARIHTGPGSWSAENFEPVPNPNDTLATPKPPFVELRKIVEKVTYE